MNPKIIERKNQPRNKEKELSKKKAKRKALKKKRGHVEKERKNAE